MCNNATFCSTHLNRNKTNSLLLLNRMPIHRIIAIVTGHYPLGRHVERLGLSSNDNCRICGSEEETVFHPMYQCNALVSRRRRFLISFLLESLTEHFDIKRIYFGIELVFSKIKMISRPYFIEL